MPFENGIEQALKVVAAKWVGVPPPKKSVSTSRRLAEPAELSFESGEERLDQIIAAGDQREVAIAATVPAERHVNVSGARVGAGFGHDVEI